MKALEIKFQGGPVPLVHPLDPPLVQSYSYSVLVLFIFSLILYIFSLILFAFSHILHVSWPMPCMYSVSSYFIQSFFCVQSHLIYIQSNLICNQSHLISTHSRPICIQSHLISIQSHLILFSLHFCIQSHIPCGRTSCCRYCHAADLEENVKENVKYKNTKIQKIEY